MKKIIWTLSVMALFAIGFAASDEDENTISESQKELTEEDSCDYYSDYEDEDTISDSSESYYSESSSSEYYS